MNNRNVPYLNAYQVIKEFQNEVSKLPLKEHVTIAIESDNQRLFRYELDVFPKGKNDEQNYFVIERLIKSMLWIIGGFRIYFAGPHDLFMRLKDTYSLQGERAFDVEFMQRIYQKDFAFIECKKEDIPLKKDQGIALPKLIYHKRIGLDLGGTHLKICAFIDKKLMWHEVISWSPKTNNNPSYHYQIIEDAIKKALKYLDNDVDSIGVSSAGIFIDNKVCVSSLFVEVKDKELLKQVENLFLNLKAEVEKIVHHEIHFRVANDGDVTAFSKARKCKKKKILGLSLGTSEAAGYIDKDGNLNGWLNELAFVPFNWHNAANEDPWSLDKGTGASYLCQEGVIALLKDYYLVSDNKASTTSQVKSMLKKAEENDPIALDIFKILGTYLAGAISYYQLFYDIKHVIILGGLMSGKGGDMLLSSLLNHLQSMEECKHITVSTISSKKRQIEQAIAASYL